MSGLTQEGTGEAVELVSRGQLPARERSREISTMFPVQLTTVSFGNHTIPGTRFRAQPAERHTSKQLLAALDNVVVVVVFFTLTDRASTALDNMPYVIIFYSLSCHVFCVLRVSCSSSTTVLCTLLLVPSTVLNSADT